MDWIDLSQDRDQWRALVNTVMWEVLEKLQSWRLLGKGSAPRASVCSYPFSSRDRTIKTLFASIPSEGGHFTIKRANFLMN
jgi:hypothetical protein